MWRGFRLQPQFDRVGPGGPRERQEDQGAAGPGAVLEERGHLVLFVLSLLVPEVVRRDRGGDEEQRQAGGADRRQDTEDDGQPTEDEEGPRRPRPSAPGGT